MHPALETAAMLQTGDRVLRLAPPRKKTELEEAKEMLAWYAAQLMNMREEAAAHIRRVNVLEEDKQNLIDQKQVMWQRIREDNERHAKSSKQFLDTIADLRRQLLGIKEPTRAQRAAAPGLAGLVESLERDARRREQRGQPRFDSPDTERICRMLGIPSPATGYDLEKRSSIERDLAQYRQAVDNIPLERVFTEIPEIVGGAPVGNRTVIGLDPASKDGDHATLVVGSVDDIRQTVNVHFSQTKLTRDDIKRAVAELDATVATPTDKPFCLETAIEDGWHEICINGQPSGVWAHIGDPQKPPAPWGRPTDEDLRHF